ncbi:hypothetical protein H6A29_10965 [Collinsella tanakaei]|nr:hypothetical protein [Collinsella tanakaei]
MLNLIKSDLYRITRVRGLRGSFWQYGLAILVVYVFLVGVALFAKSQVYASLTGAADPVPSDFSSYTEFLASMTGSLVPLCVCFMVVEHSLQEFKSNYARSVLSARGGRLSYFGSKVVFAGVLSVVMLLLSVALSTVGAWIGGYTFGRLDGPVELLGWFVGFWINVWALAVISLVVAYATRVSPMSYICSFCFSLGVVASLVSGLAYSTGGILRVLQPIRPALETLVAWMPSTSLENLADGGQMFGMRVADIGMRVADIWGPSSLALTVDPGIQALLTGVIWIAIASAAVLAIARKRDI